MSKIIIKSKSINTGIEEVKEIEVDDEQCNKIKNKLKLLQDEKKILHSYMRGDITREECERFGIVFKNPFK